MQSKTEKVSSFFQMACVCGSIAVALSVWSASEARGETCVTNTLYTTPEICADFLTGVDPDHGDDFAVIYYPSAPPDVQLKREADDWMIRCRVSSGNDVPDDIGDLTLYNPASTDVFVVKIGVGSAPGAVNVGSIDLSVPGGGAGYSSLVNSKISGNLLSGGIAVVDAGGTGGELDIEIGGNAAGTITAHTLEYLEVVGELSGDVTIYSDANGDFDAYVLTGSVTIHGDVKNDFVVSGRMDTASVEVKGSVTSSGGVSIADMENGSTAEFNTDGPVTEDYDGYLTLGNGVASGCTVEINGELYSVLNLDSKNVAGRLALLGGGTQNITNGAAVSGKVVLGKGAYTYTASASFTTVAYSADADLGIIMTDDADFEGILYITGDMSGEVKIDGELIDNRTVSITGDIDGPVTIVDDLAGTVWTGSSITDTEPIAGSISIGGAMIGDGSIYVVHDVEAGGSIEVSGTVNSGASILVGYDVGDDVGGSIQVGDLDGALTVKSVLDGGSIKVVGSIEGDGVLTVSGTATGDGTPIVLEIGEKVYAAGSISVDTLAGTLMVTGNMEGDIDVVKQMEGGTLEVGGSVGNEYSVNQATIDIADMISGSKLKFGTISGTAYFDGELTLSTGIPDGQEVIFYGPLTQHAQIDLTGDAMAGKLELKEGCETGAEIVKGGAVTSLDVILAGNLHDFECAATFASIEPGGGMSTVSGDLDGTLTITGDMAGVITAGGAISGGSSCGSEGIDIGGAMCGEITAVGTITGYINIDEEYNGDIEDDTLNACDDWFPAFVCVGSLGYEAKLVGVMFREACSCDDDDDCPEPDDPPADPDCTSNTCVAGDPDVCEYVCAKIYYGDVNGSGGPVNTVDLMVTYSCAQTGTCTGCEGGVEAGCDVYDTDTECVDPDDGCHGNDYDEVLDAYLGNPLCPDPCGDDCAPCGGEEDGGGGGGPSASEVSDALIDFLTNYAPGDDEGYTGLVDLAVGWLVEHMTCSERAALIDTLENLPFESESEFMENLLADIVDTLSCNE